jgi:hypothetical protein
MKDEHGKTKVQMRVHQVQQLLVAAHLINMLYHVITQASSPALTFASALAGELWRNR